MRVACVLQADVYAVRKEGYTHTHTHTLALSLSFSLSPPPFSPLLLLTGVSMMGTGSKGATISSVSLGSGEGGEGCDE